VYLNDDILRITDDTVTFAITGLHPSQLKRYLPVGEKIHKFEFDEISRNFRFNILTVSLSPALALIRYVREVIVMYLNQVIQRTLDTLFLETNIQNVTLMN
jgi:hypothetical protein